MQILHHQEHRLCARTAQEEGQQGMHGLLLLQPGSGSGRILRPGRDGQQGGERGRLSMGRPLFCTRPLQFG